MICAVAHAQGARRPHVVHLAVAQELGAHIVRQAHPAKQAQQISSSATLGANTALKMMSRYSSGMEPQISMKRWNARSVLPPKKPWMAP
jgi:predicted trehalose synthase